MAEAAVEREADTGWPVAGVQDMAADAVRRYYLAIAVGVGLLLAFVAQCTGRREGRLNEQIVALERRNAYLEDKVDAKDTVYIADTVVLVKTRRHTDSVFAFVVDTVIHRDTVVRLIEAERAACDAALRTCEQRVALRDSLIQNLEQLYKTEQKRGSPWLTKIGWLFAGVAAGSLIPR